MADTTSHRVTRSGTAAGMHESLKKAVTEMMVLFLLRQKSMYVYEMAQELSRWTDGVFTFNTLYLAIYRLEERGHIEEAGKRQSGNRVRVYFRMTETGQKYLDELVSEYRVTTNALDHLLDRDGKMYPPEKE